MLFRSNLPINSHTNVRLRTRNTSQAEVKRILATIRKEYKNSDVLVQRVDRDSGTGDNQLFGESLHQGDIRNVQHQNQLITEYLKQFSVDDELMESIVKINTNLNKSFSQVEAARNVVWKPKKFEFSNMFSYGEDNVVDFGRLEGTCGIFEIGRAHV